MRRRLPPATACRVSGTSGARGTDGLDPRAAPHRRVPAASVRPDRRARPAPTDGRAAAQTARGENRPAPRIHPRVRPQGLRAVSLSQRSPGAAGPRAPALSRPQCRIFGPQPALVHPRPQLARVHGQRAWALTACHVNVSEWLAPPGGFEPPASGFEVRARPSRLVRPDPDPSRPEAAIANPGPAASRFEPAHPRKHGPRMAPAAPAGATSTSCHDAPRPPAMRYWIGRTGGGIGGRNRKNGSPLPSCSISPGSVRPQPRPKRVQPELLRGGVSRDGAGR